MVYCIDNYMTTHTSQQPYTAYFSMEIALSSAIPNYAGGLGVLAADTLFSIADLGTPVVGVSLIYHQDDNPDYAFNPRNYMTLLDQTVTVQIEDREVTVLIWEKELVGATGNTCKILFLSTNSSDNKPWDRDITKYLYASTLYNRLAQEVILGIGGTRALAALGYTIGTYHLNEGHAALATLELLRTNDYNEEKVRSLCTFTTHTPVEAGHDHFDYPLAYQVTGEILPWNIRELATETDLSMTHLAINLSKHTNSVSAKHQEVCQKLYPQTDIKNVTNGIYHPRWIGTHMKKVLDDHIPQWQTNPEQLSLAPSTITDEEILTAHNTQEKELVDWVNVHHKFFSHNNISPGDLLDTGTLTIGFARRFVPYKRPDLIFKDLERLISIGTGKIQIIYANRCHPDDAFCNGLRKTIDEYSDQLRGKIKVVIIPDYDLRIAKKLITGCDIWLNTPIPPREASGTSGMKAALNGGLNLSVLDGWWIEGKELYPASGWGFGGEIHEDQDAHDVAQLLDGLEAAIDIYYNKPQEWASRMKHAIALCGYFNTHRLVQEYKTTIWDT